MPQETLEFTNDQYATLTALATAAGVTVTQYLQAYADKAIQAEDRKVYQQTFLKADLSTQKAWFDSRE